ncbi:single-stranded DNA-binding protein [Falsochrobactrum ovis]|uniref:Single-stranded DNA-binding protein n=1 Tax=Falsochrobactrum ovis TaxID=1293442 RepID=A0A364JTE8_9HYPH|nr:single-stranded DNA-binding protein [Falsochrobactrum ovis]RAK27062.1 single-strand binding protein [Falsochrobactrum ovis]
MKNITITGRIGKDAILRRTQNGDAVLGFTVAVDDGYGQNKSTIWFDASIWGKRGESLEQYLRKGTRVTANGDFGMREHNGKSYPTIRINEIDFDTPKREERGEASPSHHAGKPANFSNELDDEIPFFMEWR